MEKFKIKKGASVYQVIGEDVIKGVKVLKIAFSKKVEDEPTVNGEVVKLPYSLYREDELLETNINGKDFMKSSGFLFRATQVESLDKKSNACGDVLDNAISEVMVKSVTRDMVKPSAELMTEEKMDIADEGDGFFGEVESPYSNLSGAERKAKRLNKKQTRLAKKAVANEKEAESKKEAKAIEKTKADAALIQAQADSKVTDALVSAIPPSTQASPAESSFFSKFRKRDIAIALAAVAILIGAAVAYKKGYFTKVA